MQFVYVVHCRTRQRYALGCCSIASPLAIPPATTVYNQLAFVPALQGCEDLLYGPTRRAGQVQVDYLSVLPPFQEWCLYR